MVGCELIHELTHQHVPYRSPNLNTQPLELSGNLCVGEGFDEVAVGASSTAIPPDPFQNAIEEVGSDGAEVGQAIGDHEEAGVFGHVAADDGDGFGEGGIEIGSS